MANLSQQKRQRILQFLKTIREEHKDDDDVLIALGEIESELNAKKYGLVWEQHKEAVDVQMQDNIPVFTECSDKEISADNGGAYNFLLEGDNLHSLRLLEKTHYEQIDAIYIDPPYNTGKKDFIYEDRYIEKEDSYRHSKWLSFMHSRLSIAKTLLKKTGVIFISIDDNELANLRLLCDNIFGEQNFVAILSIENNPKGRKNSNYVSISNEYCLIYAKNFDEGYFVENIPKDIKDLAQDEDGNYVHNSGKRVLVGENNFNNNVVDFSSDKHYTIYYNSESKQYVFKKETQLEEIDTDLLNQGYTRYFSYNENGFVYNTYTEQKFEELLQLGALDFKNNKIYEKNFSTCIRIKSIVTNKKYRAVVNNVETDYSLDVKTTSAKTDLKIMFGAKESPFSNPKNVGLVKLLVSLIDHNDISILDFFAGSGTTAQAVMNLNQQDGGRRRFILCTNNENNICEEVTYERIKRVISGYGDVLGIPANLKYYRTEFVPKDADDVSEALLCHVAEMIQLEHGVKIDSSNYIMVMSDDEADALEQHWDDYHGVKALYISKNVLLTTGQNALFSGVEMHIIPDDYFKFEKQEVGESW